MSKQDKTIFNPETLMVETDTSSRQSLLKGLGVAAAGVALFALYMLLYFGVFHMHLPKTAVLLRQKAQWESRVERLGLRMDGFEEDLSTIIELACSVMDTDYRASGRRFTFEQLKKYF